MLVTHCKVHTSCVVGIFTKLLCSLQQAAVNQMCGQELGLHSGSTSLHLKVKGEVYRVVWSTATCTLVYSWLVSEIILLLLSVTVYLSLGSSCSRGNANCPQTGRLVVWFPVLCGEDTNPILPMHKTLEWVKCREKQTPSVKGFFSGFII